MKKLIPGLAVIRLVVIGCEKRSTQNFSPRATLAGHLPVNTLPMIISANKALNAGALWVPDGKCYVTKGGRLRIEEGNRIAGKKKCNSNLYKNGHP